MPGITVNGGSGSTSRKRSRRDVVADDDSGIGEEVVDVQSARSSLRNSASKRPRVSDAGSSKRRSVSFREETPGNESEDVEIDDENQVGSPPATQYEMMRDAGFEHLQHAEEDDLQATQRIRARPVNQVGDNHTADCGILETITCVNFMCHERLHCELGPLLNFIVGENGSGKSAILTAITLCLGGKASATNRGGSLKSFVKEGKDQAVLIVKIKNQGTDAYQRDLYGDSIIVERHFSKTGSSGFKLKAETGRVISTKKGEVDEIVEFFALQVDNPLNVLSQDNARQFLNAASAAQKYRFFIEGVQLEQLDRDYRLVSEYLDSNEARLGDLAELESNARGKFEKAEKMRQLIRDNEELRRKRRLYTSQLTWAQVVEQERLLEERERAITDADTRITDSEQVAEEKARLYELEDERVRRAEEALESVREEGGDQETQIEAATSAFNAAKKQLEELHTDERDAHQRLKSTSANVKDLEKKIVDEEKRVDAANGGDVSQMQEEISSQQAKERDIEDQIRQAHELTPQFEEKIASAREGVKKAAAAVEHQRDEITNMEHRISSLEQGRMSLYDGYESQVPQLLRLIDNDKGFARKPVGPLGAHIRLSKPLWSSIIEKTLGNNLNAFIVTSTQDQRRLRNLMQRVGVKNCPILIGNANRINTEGKEPDQRFDTILRVLNFDEPLVRDQLVITNSIEQVLLIERRTDAEKVMFDGPPPRNVQACLCLHDTKRHEGLRLTNRAGGNNVATSPVIPNSDQRPRMQSDTDMQISVHKETLQQLGQEYVELQGQQRRAQQAVQRCQAELTQHKNKIKSLEKSLTDVQLGIDRLLAEMDKFDGVDARLDNLRSQLESTKNEQDLYGDQYGEISLKKQEQNKVVEELKKALHAVRVAMKDFEARLRKAEDKLARYRETRRVALVEKNESIDEITKCKQDKTRAEEKRDQQAILVEEFIQQASQVHPERVEIPEGETYLSIEKKFESVVNQLEQRARRNGMSDEEIHNQAYEARKRLDEATSAVEGTKATIQSLKKSVQLRHAKWRSFQRYISSHSRVNFIYLLSERGFRGQLLLDHKNKKLQVQVEPDETRRNASGRNTKTLSGGEKSFSSICLLLAIWEAMGSPLRCLDEFDVFMDNVNRAISTNMLISAARRSVSRQYIMITPNAIEGRAKLDKDVKIIRLTDPRQRRLADL